MLANKNILLVVGGSIAAYKSPDIVRRLQDEGAQVRVILTAGGAQFITRLTLNSVCHYPVEGNQWSQSDDGADTMAHINLARWADVLLMAPASADMLARLAQGRADDLLGAVVLATEAQLMIAPAMNRQMWQSVAVKENLNVVKKRGVGVILPASGEQACGEIGVGRLPETKDIIKAVGAQFQSQSLRDKRVMITAGATIEDIDPVRFLSNRSTGKMAYFLAQHCVEMGANVTFVYGHIEVDLPTKITAVKVRSAMEMHQQVMAHIDDCDILIGAAAVGDYRVKQYVDQKIKHRGKTMSLALIANPDIISDALKHKPNLLVVGFAAESNNVIENAREKLNRKKIAMIVANDISNSEIGFATDNNAVDIITKNDCFHLSKQHKKKIAQQIIHQLVEQLL